MRRFIETSLRLLVLCGLFAACADRAPVSPVPSPVQSSPSPVRQQVFRTREQVMADYTTALRANDQEGWLAVIHPQTLELLSGPRASYLERTMWEDFARGQDLREWEYLDANETKFFPTYVAWQPKPSMLARHREVVLGRTRVMERMLASSDQGWFIVLPPPTQAQMEASESYMDEHRAKVGELDTMLGSLPSDLKKDVAALYEHGEKKAAAELLRVHLFRDLDILKAGLEKIASEHQGVARPEASSAELLRKYRESRVEELMGVLSEKDRRDLIVADHPDLLLKLQIKHQTDTLVLSALRKRIP